MATMLDIVTRAHRTAGIGGQGEELDADMAAEGLEFLNAMMHEWKLRGVDISHSDLSLAATFPLDPEYEFGTATLLASRISPNYNRPVMFDADDFFRAIQAAYMTIAEVSLPKATYQVPSKKSRDGTLGDY